MTAKKSPPVRMLSVREAVRFPDFSSLPGIDVGLANAKAYEILASAVLTENAVHARKPASVSAELEKETKRYENELLKLLSGGSDARLKPQAAALVNDTRHAINSAIQQVIKNPKAFAHHDSSFSHRA